MRLPFPRRQPNHGIWGGFGSKAADKAYQPPVDPGRGPDEVPDRHKKVRLRKRRLRDLLRRPAAATPIGIVISWLIALAILVIAVYAAIALSG